MEADGVELLDLAVGCVVAGGGGVGAREGVDQRMQRTIDRAVRCQAEGDRREIVVALAAGDGEQAGEQGDGAAVVDGGAPGRRPGGPPGDVTEDLDGVAMEVGQVREQGAEPGGVVAADEAAADGGGEGRGGRGLA